MKYFASIIIMLFSTNVFSGYNANSKSVLSGVYVYAHSDDIYVTLKSKPVTACDNTYFVIPGSVTESRRQAMLSRLLLAYASKENVNLGYDAQSGSCASGYVRIYRVG